MKEILCKAFCDGLIVREVRAGLAVSTAFAAPDGDRIGFYVRTMTHGYQIEDSGATYPALEASGLDFKSGARADALSELTTEYGVTLDDETRKFSAFATSEDELPRAAMRFVAFSLRVRDFALMTEARVASTFRDDVKKLLAETLEGRAELIERAPISPTLADFEADFVVRSRERPPVGVFLGTSDARVLEAIVVQLRAQHETHEPVSIVALLERGRSVSNLVRRQATNRLAAVPEFRGDEVAAVQRIAQEALGPGAASLH